MKKKLLFFLSFLICGVLYSKAQSTCKKELFAYLNDPDINGKTNIRKEPKGAIIQQIPANGIYEVSIIDAKEGWLKINTLESYESELKLNSSFGWVHSSIVQCRTKNYDNKPIKINELASKNSKIVATINTETAVNIIDICNNYVKITWVDTQKRKLTGWIVSEMLCSSAVTSCS